MWARRLCVCVGGGVMEACDQLYGTRIGLSCIGKRRTTGGWRVRTARLLPAYRSPLRHELAPVWCAAVWTLHAQDAEGLLAATFPAISSHDVLQLRAYLLDAFGNATRIDYGTGHETNFVIFLRTCALCTAFCPFRPAHVCPSYVSPSLASSFLPPPPPPFTYSLCCQAPPRLSSSSLRQVVCACVGLSLPPPPPLYA